MSRYQNDEEVRVGKLDPYEELANAIIIQASQDYVEDYLRWFATYPNPTIEKVKRFDCKSGTQLLYKKVSMFEQRHHDAEGELLKNVRFIHSSWFATLTTLNPTVLREGLDRLALEPRFKRRSTTKKDGIGKYRKFCEVIGTVEEKDENRYIRLKTQMTYSSDGLVSEYDGKDPDRYFKCWTDTPERFADVNVGDLVAVEGEQETKDRYYLKVLNLTTDLRTKLKQHENKVIERLKGNGGYEQE